MLPGKALEPVWPQRGPGLEKGTNKNAKPKSVFGIRMESGPIFRGLFFEVLALQIFFMISGARGPDVGLHFCFTLRALGLWESIRKCCKSCQFQRFGPWQAESFYRS